MRALASAYRGGRVRALASTHQGGRVRPLASAYRGGRSRPLASALPLTGGRRLVALLGALPLAALLGAGPLSGQESGDGSGWTADLVPVDPWAAPTPFGPGEHLVYKVKVGIFSVGEGHLTVEAVDSVRGNKTYRAVMGINGSLMGLAVDDVYTTWFDVTTLQSWRYIRDIHEVTYESYRHYEFYPERRKWEREDNDEFGPLGSSIPLDDIAFVYFVRTLPLEVGKSYTLSRYFKDEGNPVVVEVVRRDVRETEAGKFNTIVVKPKVKTDGLFAEGGQAELHFTDDERRLLVYMKSDIPNFPGSLTLHLKSVQEGFPLNPHAREEVLGARKRREGGGA